MKIKLVFLDWRKFGQSISLTEKGVDLSGGDFHSGSTFTATIELDGEQEQELRAALLAKYQPCWWMTLDDPYQPTQEEKK